MKPFRIRQIVIAADDASTIDQLQVVLGLAEPYVDPGVAEFGLVNAVFTIGDQFLEVVVPVTDTAPARRFIDRSGEGGYMAIFQLPDLAAARARLDDLGMRRVWNIDLKDISASHIHPADIGGAIVSIDQPVPEGSWRWAGPQWTDRSATGRVTGITLTSKAPDELAKSWASALGAPLSTAYLAMPTDDGLISFESGETAGIACYHLAMPEPDAILARAKENGLTVTDHSFTIAGVEMVISPA